MHVKPTHTHAHTTARTLAQRPSTKVWQIRWAPCNTQRKESGPYPLALRGKEKKATMTPPPAEKPALRLTTPGNGPYKGWHGPALAGLLGSVLRGGVGYWVLTGLEAAPRPPAAAPLELYGTEGCPACQRAREACSALDLAYLHRPCPAGGRLWRPAAAALVRGARGPDAPLELPVLVDGGQVVVGASAVVAHLFARYGPPRLRGRPSLALRSDALAGLGCRITRAMRPGRGLTAAPVTRASAAMQPLRVHGYECSPFVRLVREVLDELEVPALMLASAHGSPRRAVLRDTYGVVQFPCLEDPNQQVAMYESGPIIEYLRATYG